MDLLILDFPRFRFKPLSPWDRVSAVLYYKEKQSDERQLDEQNW